MSPARTATFRPALIAGCILVALVTELRAAEQVQFARDVVTALTRIGCNAGACHVHVQGRGGFRLSLLGFDPAADYRAMFEVSRGRRVFAASPRNSLLLLKATATLPHGGGSRLDPDSPTYRILHDYI